MKILTRAAIIGIIATCMTYSAEPAAAQGNPQSKAPSSTTSKLATSVRSGTIMFMNKARMVVLQIRNGKSKQLELILNAETALRGEMAVGTPVIVHYRTENNCNIATNIQTRKSLQLRDLEPFRTEVAR